MPAAVPCSRSIRGQLGEFVKSYSALCLALPWTTGFTVCYFKGSMSDIFAQRVVEGKDKFDIKRNFAFALFSGWYSGWVGHIIYVLGYDRMYGTGKTVAVVTRKMLTEHLLHVPCFCMPIYFLWQAAILAPLEEEKPVPRLDVQLFPEVASRWCADILSIMVPFWQLWTPAHLVTFIWMPAPLRVTWIACVSSVWMVIHSYLTHKHIGPQAAPDEVARATEREE